MFKKNILALSLSIAMASSYTANAVELTQFPLSPEVQQEITKYSAIIAQLKVQLKDKEEYNILLQSKLNTAIELVKKLEPEKVTPKQIVHLNDLILTLTQTTQENAINNKDFDKKIQKLEQFLNLYKENQLKGIKTVSPNINPDNTPNIRPESTIKENTTSTDGLSNDVIEANKKLAEQNQKIKTEQETKNKKETDEISNDVIEANKALAKKNEELRIEQDKKNSVKTPEKTPEKISFEDSSAKSIENIEKPPIDVKKDGMPSTKTVKSVNTPVEEKTFMQTFEEKIENTAIWFKELFGMEDSINKDQPPVISAPSQIEIQMKKDKLAEILKEKQIAKEKEEKAQKELEEKNKDVIKIDETPVHLEDKVIKKENVTPINLNPELETESSEIIDNDKNVVQESSIPELNVKTNPELQAEDAKSSVQSEISPELKKDVGPALQKESVLNNNETEKFIKENQEISPAKEIPIPNVKDEEHGDMIILKAQKPVSDLDDNIKKENPDLSVPLKQPKLYSVKKGDNLTKIVKNHFNTQTTQDTVDKVQEFASLNGIETKDLIHIGDVIRIS